MKKTFLIVLLLTSISFAGLLVQSPQVRVLAAINTGAADMDSTWISLQMHKIANSLSDPNVSWIGTIGNYAGGSWALFYTYNAGTSWNLLADITFSDHGSLLPAEDSVLIISYNQAEWVFLNQERTTYSIGTLPIDRPVVGVMDILHDTVWVFPRTASTTYGWVWNVKGLFSSNGLVTWTENFWADSLDTTETRVGSFPYIGMNPNIGILERPHNSVQGLFRYMLYNRTSHIYYSPLDSLVIPLGTAISMNKRCFNWNGVCDTIWGDSLMFLLWNRGDRIICKWCRNGVWTTDTLASNDYFDPLFGFVTSGLIRNRYYKYIAAYRNGGGPDSLYYRMLDPRTGEWTPEAGIVTTGQGRIDYFCLPAISISNFTNIAFIVNTGLAGVDTMYSVKLRDTSSICIDSTKEFHASVTNYWSNIDEVKYVDGNYASNEDNDSYEAFLYDYSYNWSFSGIDSIMLIVMGYGDKDGGILNFRLVSVGDDGTANEEFAPVQGMALYNSEITDTIIFTGLSSYMVNDTDDFETEDWKSVV